MNNGEIVQFPVTHRTKGNTIQAPECRDMADEPEMKALSRMVNSEQLDLGRTIGHLKAKAAVQAFVRWGGGGRRFRDGP